METIEIVFLAFLGFTAIIGMFSMLILLRDIIKEGRAKDNRASAPVAPIVQVVAPSALTPAAPAPVVVPAPAAEPAPVSEPAPVVEEVKPVIEEVVEQSEEIAVADDTVTFSSEKALTIDDKYLELTNEQKNYYDEIIKYASKVEGSRRFKNARYEEYKVGKNRLVRMLIKRGVIVCEFILPNNDFKNYVNENKIKIKAAPTVLKIVDADGVQVAKDSIDIAIKAIEEEKEYKRQQTRERRKQARISKQG